MKTSIAIAILAIAIVCGYGLLAVSMHSQSQSQQSVTFGTTEDVFSASGATSSVVTVNSTATQLLDNNWTNFARISNVSSSMIFCSADGLTAASSVVSLSNYGFIIYPSSTAGSVCLGRGSLCDPYIGRVNCVAATATQVGIFKK
jgi:hypothetical protein